VEVIEFEVPVDQSRRNFRYTDEKRLDLDEMVSFMAPYMLKFMWFSQNGYEPHYFQQLFHAMHNQDEELLRFRHLVAGRRGGKTLSAAWELAYYCLNPEQFHWDAHKKHADRPIYAWVLYKDNPTGHAAWTTFREVLKQCGLTHGREYKENRGNHWFEFENGAFVHFRTADDPESLRGAGLDWMWIDEAAFIPNERAWQVSSPGLADHEGLLVTTTTPSGKNWYYDEFFSPKAMTDEIQGHVEYRSIDNPPGFPKEEWIRLQRVYHPMLFKQEFMAAFDALQGRELLGEWLHYYTLTKKPDEVIVGDDTIGVPRTKEGKLDLTLYMGVDPAISLSDQADRFAMSLLGVTKDHSQVFLLDLFVGRLPFAEQIDKIKEWHVKYRPMIIGIEANAFQAALAQQVSRLDTLPPVVPMMNTDKKENRIIGMSPLFRIGKIRIRKDQSEFIDEWLDYDTTVKNPKDDCLDCVEIALQCAGALLPQLPVSNLFDVEKNNTIEDWARRDLPKNYNKADFGFFDDMMGSEW
jgi:phage terminase large subunit-like protein